MASVSVWHPTLCVNCVSIDSNESGRVVKLLQLGVCVALSGINISMFSSFSSWLLSLSQSSHTLTPLACPTQLPVSLSQAVTGLLL
jgi:hypothetical protein